jgi:hypothetical protein
VIPLWSITFLCAVVFTCLPFCWTSLYNTDSKSTKVLICCLVLQILSMVNWNAGDRVIKFLNFSCMPGWTSCPACCKDCMYRDRQNCCNHTYLFGEGLIHNKNQWSFTSKAIYMDIYAKKDIPFGVINSIDLLLKGFPLAPHSKLSHCHNFLAICPFLCILRESRNNMLTK